MVEEIMTLSHVIFWYISSQCRYIYVHVGELYIAFVLIKYCPAIKIVLCCFEQANIGILHSRRRIFVEYMQLDIIQ